MTWPISNPVFGTYQFFELGVAMYLGVGEDQAGLTEPQQKKVDWIIQRGLQQFYSPPTMGDKPFTWSFMFIPATIATVSGTATYDLPTACSGIVDEFAYSVSASKRRLELISPQTFLALQSKSSASGTALYVCVRPKSLVLTAEQLFEIGLYPTPDAVLTLTYRYRTNHVALDATNLYPLGTRVHAETIMASCLSIAEMVKTGAHGICYEHFKERLTASLQLDRLLNRNDDVIVPSPDIAVSTKAV